jgi:hypothetical protein
MLERAASQLVALTSVALQTLAIHRAVLTWAVLARAASQLAVLTFGVARVACWAVCMLERAASQLVVLTSVVQQTLAIHPAVQTSDVQLVVADLLAV